MRFKIKDDQNRRRPNGKQLNCRISKMENNQNRRLIPRSEYDQNGRRLKKMMIKKEDDQKFKRPKWKTTKI